jgi:plasmid replication initiation protein
MPNKLSTKNMVAHSNTLNTEIRTNHIMLTSRALKAFKIVVSCINTKDIYNDNWNIVTFKKEELYSLMTMKEARSWSWLKSTVKELYDGDIKQELQYSKTKSRGEYNRLLSGYIYDDWDEIITIKLNKDLKDYIMNLKANYISYPVLDLKYLEGKYTIMLYELIYSDKYKTFDKKKLTYSIKQLREVTGTTNNHKRIDSFMNLVIKKSSDSINKADLGFIVKPVIIRGMSKNSVDSIRFELIDKPTAINNHRRKKIKKTEGAAGTSKKVNNKVDEDQLTIYDEFFTEKKEKSEIAWAGHNEPTM